jgi:hypothetical protein
MSNIRNEYLITSLYLCFHFPSTHYCACVLVGVVVNRQTSASVPLPVTPEPRRLVASGSLAECEEGEDADAQQSAHTTISLKPVS